MEMDDIDMMLARIERARDKLTAGRIARRSFKQRAKSEEGL